MARIGQFFDLSDFAVHSIILGSFMLKSIVLAYVLLLTSVGVEAKGGSHGGSSHSSGHSSTYSFSGSSSHLSSSHSSTRSVSVHGYTKKNGTVVAPYHRSAPDHTKANNWSTKGNVNPYTDKVGTKNAH
jgi:hypothetical protein